MLGEVIKYYHVKCSIKMREDKIKRVSKKEQNTNAGNKVVTKSFVISPIISVITSNLNGLTTVIKRQIIRMDKKYQLYVAYLNPI